MLADHHTNRVDTLQKKDAIYQRIGAKKAESYFNHLERFLKLELSKIEFDKSCKQIIGGENIFLHNELIRSIIHNAMLPRKEVQKAQFLSVKVANFKRSHLADTLPQHPRKRRSCLNRDSKSKERKSPIGPLGKSPCITCEETVSRLQSGAELLSFSGRPLMVEDGEEVEQWGPHWWTSVTAPVGLSLNMGDDHKGLNNHCFIETCQSRRELPDTESLGRVLQEKLGVDGFGISPDSVNLLNKSLDVYVKKIISQCVGICGDPFNTYVSMLDFRVAMESNPSVLGEDWPIQLEKICNYS